MSFLTLLELTAIGQDSKVWFKLSGLGFGQESFINNHYISSLVTSAAEFAQGIESTGELRIDCTLVKDVIFGEVAPFSNYNAATNWSLIRTIAINVARMCGYDSLKAEFSAHDIDKLFSF